MSYQHTVQQLSHKYDGKFVRKLSEEDFRQDDLFIKSFERSSQGRIEILTTALSRFIQHEPHEVSLKDILTELDEFVRVSLHQYPKISDETFLKMLDSKKLDMEQKIRLTDFRIHQNKYVIQLLESIFLIFLAHTKLCEKTKPIKILKDLAIMCYDYHMRYSDGRIFADLKLLMQHQDRSMLCGSFLKQYIRISREPHSDFRSSFLYSIEFLKKGLYTLSLKKTISNLDATLSLLTSKKELPNPNKTKRLMEVAVTLLNPQHMEEDFLIDPNFSSRSSRNFSYGFGASWLSVDLEDQLMSIWDIQKQRDTLKNFTNSWIKSDGVRNDSMVLVEVEEKVVGKKETEFVWKYMNIPCSKFSNYEVVSDHMASIKVLQEPNKNRFLSIQNWYYQNLLNGLQRQMLDNWFSKPFSTHHGVDTDEILRRCEKFIPSIYGFESVDYSAATDHLPMESTQMYLETYLEYTGNQELIPSVTEAISARFFDLKGASIEHESMDAPLDHIVDDVDKEAERRTIEAGLDPSDTKRFGFLFGMYFRKSVRKYLVDKHGAKPEQKNGQMMGNPLSFSVLCGLNLTTWLATVEKELNVRFHSIRDEEGKHHLTVENMVTHEFTKMPRGRFVDEFIGPCVINGDDGLLPILSNRTKEIHSFESSELGFVVNDLKSFEDFIREVSPGKFVVQFNINSILFEMRFVKKNGVLTAPFSTSYNDVEFHELQPIGYFNLSLFYGKNVKQGKDRHDKTSIGDDYNALLENISVIPVRLSVDNLFMYYHSDVIKSSNQLVLKYPGVPKIKDSFEISLYLPVSLGGSHMIQSIMQEDLPFLFESANIISYQAIGRIMKTLAPDDMDVLSTVTIKDISYGKSLECPWDGPLEGLTPADVHSKAITWLTKQFILDMIQTREISLKEFPGSIGSIELFDLFLSELQVVFRNFSLLNVETQGIKTFTDSLDLFKLEGPVLTEFQEEMERNIRNVIARHLLENNLIFDYSFEGLLGSVTDIFIRIDEEEVNKVIALFSTFLNIL